MSRIIDVIERSGGGILEAGAVGVTGCSRFGKGAFVAGAFDQRIALTMPIESGSAGVPILRGIPGESGAQPLSSAFNEQPWLGDAVTSRQTTRRRRRHAGGGATGDRRPAGPRALIAPPNSKLPAHRSRWYSRARLWERSHR